MIYTFVLPSDEVKLLVGKKRAFASSFIFMPDLGVCGYGVLRV